IHFFARPLPQHRQLEDLSRRAAGFQPQDMGELPIDLPTEEAGHLSSENLSEQGMSETNGKDVLVEDGNQPSPFEIYENALCCHLFSDPKCKRFPNGEHFQEATLCLCEAIKASGNSPL